jgi:superfamily II DNA or RNA helicase
VSLSRDQRRQLKSTVQQLRAWVREAESGLQSRELNAERARRALETLSARVSPLRDGDETVLWLVLPIHDADRRALEGAVAHLSTAPVSPRTTWTVDLLRGEVSRDLGEVASLLGLSRLFSSSETKERAEAAARRLCDFENRAEQFGVGAALAELPPGAELPTDAHLELVRSLPGFDDFVCLEHPQHRRLAHSVRLLTNTVSGDEHLRSAARQAADALRRAETDDLIANMPVTRLRDATRERLSVAPLEANNVATVADVLRHEADLERLPGVGELTATRIRGAAHTLLQTTFDEMPVRIDIRRRRPEACAVLRAVFAWQHTRRVMNDPNTLELLGRLAGVAEASQRRASLLVAAHSHSLDAFRHDVEALVEAARGLSPQTLDEEIWSDFFDRPADYFSWLAELGLLVEDDTKVHGDLPDEIVHAIREHPLYGDHLTASLRGYQSFGARFALVQRKVIIGDEMGLGKTVESIAVLAHLRAKGPIHAVVVCPAAVVTNWTREVAAKSTLIAHRVHGPQRDTAARNWALQGGVAVTTFETLGWFMAQARRRAIACLVIDEAHYIKNPTARRSIRSAELIEHSERAILLTGTPLENKLDEFRSLVRYVRPDLAIADGRLSPRRFRVAVAPAYLRRNQEDVLTELPELVEVDEWLPMSDSDAREYRDAVLASQFHDMRQAAMVSGPSSAKLQRLTEIVEEAEANSRRVIVFSQYRQVLDVVHRALPGRCFGPVSGSVPAQRRQDIVDEFGAADGGAVLVAQIVAGGVGLNIQAASVVVICEPQLKPTTEWQAIARARRMGQLESVQVHRLLSEDGVDRRVTEILAHKADLFAEFARDSETAASAPEAYDISEAELVQLVLEEERLRLLMQDGRPSTDQIRV